MSLNSVDEFISHKATEGSGDFLGNWKKDRQIDVWMHTQRVPQPRWVHPWKKIHVHEDRDTRRVTKDVWSDDFVCLEEEVVLRKQHHRDDDDNRDVPPVICPDCLMIEWVRNKVRSGELSWTEPLFKFEGSDPRKAVIIHAGGIYNGYKDATDDEIAELKEAGVYVRDAWQENLMAKLSYIFSVVDNANPSRGVCIDIETGLLGDRVKKVIAKAREDKGEDEGNPFVNPYAIRWKYDKDAKNFNEKYDALQMTKIQLTDQIRELITGKAPTISHLLEPGNVGTLRAQMEHHSLLELPWDEFFAPAKARLDRPNKAVAKKAEPTTRKTEPATKKSESVPEVGRRRKVAAPPPEEKTIPCDDCGIAMSPKATKCPNPKCKAEYEVSDEDVSAVESEPESVQTKAAPKSTVAKKGATIQKKSAPQEESKEEDEDDDSIPF